MKRARPRTYVGWVVVPALSILLALLVASVLIIASGLIDQEKRFDLLLPLVAYGSLLEGAFGSVRGFANMIVAATPLMLTGLAVGVGLKAGLFNIGATGQVLLGGFAAALVGVTVADASPFAAIPLAMLGGILAGALAGFIPGFLKAYTGAHEVVTTIMLNAIIQLAVSGLVNDVFRAPGFSFARTASVGNATLIGAGNTTLHVGVLFAIICIPLSYWLLWRTTVGFEIRAVGANPTAALYAGMKPRRMMILTMSLCGAFAGLAGAIEILRLGYYPAVFGTSIGFDGITVALLGQANPIGIMLSAFLLGAMRAGAPLMQIEAGVPVEIIDVIQGVILIFLAAEIVVRRIFRLRTAQGAGELQTITRTYGEKVAG
ncbi:MAG TPA: ABC transporter permease [Anaerolineales bacterium]|nr:ABC transporter permease [Anaerolineales bacterium]